MQRILLLVTDLELGGTPTVVRELAVRLGRTGGAQVQVACLSAWGPMADQILACGVKVTALGAQGVYDLRILPRLMRLMRREQFDTVFSFLIHANALATAVMPLVGPVRWIQSVQTTQPRPRWHWLLQRAIHPAADVVVVPSESVARAAQEWAGIPRSKIVVIPNAVDAREFDSMRYGRPARATFEVGFIGRLDPIKCVPDLVEAVSRLKGLVHLSVFGEGPDRTRIENRIAQLGIGHLVTLHGAVARPQEALSQIDLLVLPSAAEGMPMVPIEAMAAGVPVLGTDVPGIRDVVKDGLTGLLTPPASPPRLAEAIKRLVHDAALRQRLVKNAAREVRERFSWDQVIRQYQALLGL
jgi:glycosyltransferase involved in cell wall biosynthesis